VLDLMRKHAKSWLIKAALGGIIVTFIFWYGWSGPGEEGRDYVAKVNDTVITYDYFNTLYNSELEKIRLRFRGAMPADLPEKLNLKKKVLEGMVNQILLLDEARRLGIFIVDEDLVRDIRTTPIFMRNGVFDDYLYKEFLREIKLSPGAYETLRRAQLLQEQIVGTLTDGVKTEPAEVRRLWHFQNDKLRLAAILIKAADMKKGIAADKQALEDFFKKNRSKYEIPPALDLEYSAFSWKDIKDKTTIGDDEARAYYDGRPEEFTIPEKIRARHILLKIPGPPEINGTPQAKPDASKIEEVKKKIEKILAEIKGGKDFKKVATEVSQDEHTAEKGGDLGFITRGTLQPELETAAFDLDVGEVSDPVLTTQGWHLIMVDEKKPEELKKFEDVKADIVAKLTEEKARSRIQDLADEFYEKVYRTEKLEEPAKEFGFGTKRAEFVTKAGGIPKIGNGAELMEEAFSLKEGEISKLINVGDRFVIMKVVKVIDERVPELDEVRKSVEKDFLKEQALTAARKKAEKLLDALEETPGKPDEVAKRFGLEWDELDPVSRTTGLVPRLGNAPEVAEMLTTVSMASPVFPSPIDITGGVAVVRLTKIERASDARYEKEAVEFAKWIKDLRRREFLEGWVRRLRETASIDVQGNAL
jgi:peptidyl-prolyl cis-trans isomerase D